MKCSLLPKIIDDVNSELNDTDPPFACEHLIRFTQDQEAIFICSSHPSLGVFCAKCALQHNQRHPERHTHCDTCGEQDEDVRVFAWPRNPEFLTVSHPTGKMRLGVFKVVMLNLGTCKACAKVMFDAGFAGFVA